MCSLSNLNDTKHRKNLLDILSFNCMDSIMCSSNCITDEKQETRKPNPPNVKQRPNWTTGKLEYFCTVCQKSFQSRTQKYYHYGCFDIELKKHKCHICEKCFATRSHLAYHLETHNNKIHQCDVCMKSFSNSLVLRKHLKIHTKTEHFFCTQCSKKFKNKETLAAHIRRHENILDFSCETCYSKYATKAALMQHRLSHFSKKHECHECGKRFLRNSILNLHLSRHKKHHLYPCSVCFKNFSDLSALQRHKKLHNNVIAKYRCIKCETITSRKDNAQRHVRNMHISEKFSDCIEVLQYFVGNEIIAENTEDCSAPQEEYNLPKTVANSSVIKCIGNVIPVKVPNIVADNSNNKKIIPPISPVKNVSTLIKKSKEVYDPIKMYRKIIGTNEKEEEEDEDADGDIDLLADNHKDTTNNIDKPLNTNLNTSNFSETHWRKNFKYAYQHQEF